MLKRTISLASCALLLTMGLTGCQNDDAAPTMDGLAGTWQLVDRQCFCPGVPLPDQTISFTATDFAKYINGTLTDQGTYTMGTPTLCGVAASEQGLLFQSATSSKQYLDGATYTLKGDTLTLDYGRPCDASLDTYVRKAPQKK